jgi:S1-C subfamily serine protease
MRGQSERCYLERGPAGTSHEGEQFGERSVLPAFLAGMLGGGLVVALAVMVIAATGTLSRSTATATRAVATPITDAGSSEPTRALTAHQIYDLVAPGVVSVTATGVTPTPSAGAYLRGEGGQEGTATGSGLEIDDRGTVLTNWHVIEGSEKVTVSAGGHKSVEAKIVGKDPSSDLALLRIPPRDFTLQPLAFGDSNMVAVGEPVYAIGNPFGYTRTLTTGVISGLQREIKAPDGSSIDDVLQTDAPINPGNSGGPLLNARGQVIGINSQIVTSRSTGGSVGISLAIPIDRAKAELPALERGGP